MKSTCGIYKIENKNNGKVYIGQSVEIEKRKNRHFNELKGGKHINIHLQRAFDMYGVESFSHEIVEKCSKNMLDEREIFWIDFYNSNNYNFGYNQDSGGQKGKKVNGDVKRRIGTSRTYPSGCDNVNSLFKENDVVDIKYMLIEGFDVGSIADKYNTNKQNIFNIRSLQTYIEIAEEINEVLFSLYNVDEIEEVYNSIISSVKENQNKRRNLNKDMDEMKLIVDVKKYIYENDVCSFSELTKIFNTNSTTILNIAKCNTYKNILPEYNTTLKKRYDKNLNDEKRLSIDQVRQIKHYLSLGDKKITNKILANKFNIDSSAISNIKLLKSYKDISPEYNDILLEIYSNFKKPKILNEEEVIEIKKILIEETNYTHDYIGKIFEIDPSQISRIKNLKIYKDYGEKYNLELIKKYNIAQS